MDRELKNLTLNISQLAALSGVHRQTAAARLQNLPVAGGHESNLKLYRVVDIVSAFLALPPPVAEGEMDAHERKALMNPLMILVKIIKLRWIHILSYDQMVSRKINNQTTRCANSIFYTTLFTNSAPNYT
ncbi:DUF1441 family protein [Escherichia fergusonii]|uniref:DUF1441 family protein n=1 Tax=Escherichia fergusonii TaxID=564 RepID=UPI001CBEDBA3|nr:DUF1441 family protein [Escherichia fergusonii]